MLSNSQAGPGRNFSQLGARLVVHLCNDVYMYTCLMFRFDPVPESGESKGLMLVLDAHSDLVTASTVTDEFQAKLHLSIQKRLESVNFPPSFHRVSKR